MVWEQPWKANLPWAGSWRLARGAYDFDDVGGAVDAYDIFEVTGDVMVKVIGVCEADLTQAAPTANVRLGVDGTGTTDVLIESTEAVAITEEEIWHDATPAHSAEKIDLYGEACIIAAGQNIIFSITDEDLTAGRIVFYCYWKPLSENGQVVPA